MTQQLLQDDWSWHFWKGIKFHYPLCCIFWFCNVVSNYGVQKGGLQDRMLSENYGESVTQKQADFEERNMCPDCISQCLQQNVVKKN